ncbi:MAG: AMP-binding protein [Opitutaceae bacterium]|nr:AMP-binding protein [Opitutaceae bacterium]
MTRNEFARRLGAGTTGATAARAEPAVIDERDPARFMAAFASAAASGGDVFLADPDWSERARAEMAEVVRFAGANADPDAARAGGWLMIPSGGTGGRLKFARHDHETLAAAVRGFTTHFGFERVNAIGVLPLHHVSGLMAWIRCALTGGGYIPWQWKQLESGDLPKLGNEEHVISLVPTQLQRLLNSPNAVEWLGRFHVIFLGGAPAWPALLDAASEANLPLSLSYGMTETAAMVTALRPGEFLAGERTSGAALPHAHVRVDAEGLVRISGESIFRGYFPEWREAREFMTADMGRLDARGHLTLLGRSDSLIITGGKKVNPQDIEAVLRASGEFSDVAVIGIPDAEWGEAVVACYPSTQRPSDITRAVAGLTGAERPKHFVAISEWPRNAQGKVNRAALVALAHAAMR